MLTSNARLSHSTKPPTIQRNPKTRMNLKPTHKAVKDYYTALDQYARLGITNETSVRSACQSLLESCARQEKWTFVPEYSMTCLKKTRISVDGALFDESRIGPRLLGSQRYERRLADRNPAQVRQGLPPRQHPIPNPRTRHPLAKRTRSP